MSRFAFRTRNLAGAALMLAMAFATVPSVAVAAPYVEHGTFNFNDSDLGVLNICGDLADFHFANTGSYTVVDQGDGALHIQVVERSTYTVTFLDTSLGGWDGRLVSTLSVQATPGGTFTSSSVSNSFEGPVRIHEQTVFVLAGDGTVRVDSYRIDVMGCPG